MDLYKPVPWVQAVQLYTDQLGRRTTANVVRLKTLDTDLDATTGAFRARFCAGFLPIGSKEKKVNTNCRGQKG